MRLFTCFHYNHQANITVSRRMAIGIRAKKYYSFDGKITGNFSTTIFKIFSRFIIILYFFHVYPHKLMTHIVLSYIMYASFLITGNDPICDKNYFKYTYLSLITNQGLTSKIFLNHKSKLNTGFTI